MQEVKVDLAIIGSGIAGVAAATVAADAGKSTCLILGAPGKSALSSGLFDGAHLPALEQFASVSSHPQQLLPPTLKTALSELIDWSETPALLADCWGRLHWARGAQASQMAGDLSTFCDGSKQGKVGIVQFGYHRASPDPAAQFNRTLGPGVECIDLLLSGPSDHPSPHLWAAYITANEEELCNRWSQELASFKQDNPDLALVLFPPILGFLDVSARCQRLSQTAGVACAELLATSPSVPGYRLYELLQRHVASIATPVALLAAETTATGLITCPGQATKMSIKGEHPVVIESCELSPPDGPQEDPLPSTAGLRLYAKEWILATGGWTGGGLQKDGPIPATERLLGLPLAVFVNGTLTPLSAVPLIHPTRHSAQAILETGVPISEHHQPCDSLGVSLYQNLRATGDLTLSSLDRSLQSLAAEAAEASRVAIAQLD